jgi:hypothetical protein
MNDDGARYRRQIEDVRVPVVKCLPIGFYRMLHHSCEHIERMRRGIESADAQIIVSAKACSESLEMLKRLR